MRFLSSLLLAFSLLTPVTAKSPEILHSIAPVTMNPHPDSVAGCTATFIGTARKLWLTAGHCIGPIHAFYFVDRHPTQVLAQDVHRDLALLMAIDEYVVPSVEFGERPSVGDQLKVAGFPLSSRSPFYFEGILNNERYSPAMSEGVGYSFVDVRVGQGMSGGPVIDGKGKLVGVVQIGTCTTPGMFCELTGISPWSELKSFLQKYRILP